MFLALGSFCCRDLFEVGWLRFRIGPTGKLTVTVKAGSIVCTSSGSFSSDQKYLVRGAAWIL